VLDRGGTEIPASAVLEAMAGLNPAAMADHPVVTQARPLAAGLPVQIHLRFDTWDVLSHDKNDSKGAVLSIQPDQVSVIDPATGDEIATGPWTMSGPSGVLTVGRSLLTGRTFALQAHFPPGVQISADRNSSRRFPASPTDPLIWSTAGWTARDTTTSGIWSLFSGIQIGNAAAPVAFWVGVKVRLALSYQEQIRDGYGNKTVAKPNTRRVAPGHQVRLYGSGSAFIGDETFTTDTDGEVSGVAFQVTPGSMLGVAIERRLTFGQTVIRVSDDPGSGTQLYPDPYFYSSASSPGVFFTSFTAGALEAPAGPLPVVIGADPADDTATSTPDAAAFHALKFARYAHEGVALLGSNAALMPAVHEFRVLTGGGGASTTVSDDPVTSTAITTTHFPPQGWFTRRTVIHEYGHAIVYWLSSTVRDHARRTDYGAAQGACQDEAAAVAKWPGYWHSESLVTVSGTALTEGLTLCFESFFGEGGKLDPSGMKGPPGTKVSWPKYIFLVYPPGPPNISATGFSGSFGPALQLSASKGRDVEAVFAYALFEYVKASTGFGGFLLGTTGDSERRCVQPQAFLDTWQSSLPASSATAKLDQLHRLVSWLLIDPITVVVGDKRFWTGRYPAGAGGVPYPKVYDVLLRVFGQDLARTGPAPTPEESFTNLHNDCLVPWNLEQDLASEPTPPILGGDY
jgi:hypothetical protein